jgi:hypothetical protein
MFKTAGGGGGGSSDNFPAIRATLDNTGLSSSGQFTSGYNDAGASCTIDWNNGNIQKTSCGGVITFNNMRPGARYLLIDIDTGSTMASFSTPGWTTNFVNAPNGMRNAFSTTTYQFDTIGSTAFVNWGPQLTTPPPGFAGITASPYNGTMGGGAGLGSANAACTSNFGNSHMCTYAELQKAYVVSGGTNFLPTTAWTIDTNGAMPCQTGSVPYKTSATSTGHTFSTSTAPFTLTIAVNCSSSFNIACCY